MNFSCIQAPWLVAASRFSLDHGDDGPEGAIGWVPWGDDRSSDRGGHRVEEFRVGLCLLKAAEQQLHSLNGRKRAQNLAQHPDAAQLVGRQEQFVLTRARPLNINGREDALIGKAAVE